MNEKDRALALGVLKQFRVLLRSMDNHYRRVERRSGLGGAQLWALSEAAHPSGLTLGELAARLAIHLSTASNLVSRLESLGLVERRREADDRRKVCIRATAAGKRALKRAPPPSAGLLQQALMRMDRRELLALQKSLARLLRRMGHPDRAGAAVPLGSLLGRAPLR
jgi:DNA-binding MarR family transcriptional regulator